MTQTLANHDAPAHEDVIVTAALRAGLAWSMRETEPRAWREVSRMTGVILAAWGSSLGTLTPDELVVRLHAPLGGLVADPTWGEPISSAAVLGPDDKLTEEAREWGAEYVNALLGGADDPSQQWLPSWVWQRSEQVERSVFDRLTSGSEGEYVSARRFIIEHPAGAERELVESANDVGARRAANYGPIPAERVWSDGSNSWWWACPACHWPMRIDGATVRCEFSHHDARYQVRPRARGDKPRLTVLSSGRRAAPPPKRVENSVCVDHAVWKHIVTPGLTELRLEQGLGLMPGVVVELWPRKDAIDLLVRTAGGRVWEVDVKDHARYSSITRWPPAASTLVVPDYRSSQVKPLATALASKRVYTVRGFMRRVRDVVAGEAT